MQHRHRRSSALFLAFAAMFGTGLSTAPATKAWAASDCDGLTATVYHSTNPNLQTDLLTTSEGEHTRSQSRYGFTGAPAELGQASARASADLVAVVRLYNAKTADFTWAVGESDIAAAQQRGFSVVGTNFYAPVDQQHCTTGVHRFIKGEHFAFASSSTGRAELTADGWVDQGAIFQLRKPSDAPAPPSKPTGGSFSIAVIPDTQTEVTVSSDKRLANRARWLADNADALNLSYVLHTGDVVNWGWLSPKQFDTAEGSFKTLADAGLPYSIAIGNHDTAAVGHDGVAGSRLYGGGAYVDNPECQAKLGDECKSWLLIRNTEAFNDSFPRSGLRNVGGVFEPGKVDNMWTTFSAEGTDWLVLTLEYFARKDAVAWAAGVVKSHPKHNVIVQTHGYLTASGGIDQSSGGYGSTTGQYLFDNLIKIYPNIKLVFSGHVGQGSARVDTGTGGNRILSFLGGFHSLTTNPVRIVTINTNTGSVTTRVVAPATDETWSRYGTTNEISLLE